MKDLKKLFKNLSFEDCIVRYIKSVNLGLLKIMSKMGISVLSSYRGGCNFETVGLSRTVVNEYFPGMMSKISGIGLTGIEKKLDQFIKMLFKLVQISCQLVEFIDIEKMVKNISIKGN